MNKCILYSFRRCPYAIRARWAILNCGINVLIREVSLKDKPIELTDASPKGTVPVLITNTGEVIDESLAIIKWSIKKVSADKIHLLETEENDKTIKDLINENDHIFKYHLDRYKYANKFEDINHKEHQLKAKEILRSWDSLIAQTLRKHEVPWLTGKKQSIADWSLWPFVRQYRLVEPDEFDNDCNLYNLRKWLNYYLEHELYPCLMNKYSYWHNSKEESHFPK